MRYRKLGATGIEVSEIGFGAWGIGGTNRGSIAYGPTDDAQSLEALNRAFELGVNFFDTADLYGAGQSDRLLGEAFHARRDRVVFASKVGYTDAKGSSDYSPQQIERVLDESLKRLRTDYLDVYQLHDPPLAILEERPEILETIRRLKREGKIRAVGISARTPDDALIFVERFEPDCVQVNFNLTDLRASRNGLFALAAECRVACIIRTPLCFGFLSGEYAADANFAEGDHRRLWSKEQRELWAKAPALFREIAARNGSTSAQLALRFCLSYPSVATTIPGMLTSAQVEENAHAGELGPLPAEDLAMMERIHDGNEFFLGRSSTLKPKN